MRFLKINIKVLLILCLFSGILFLSSGCGENNNNNNDDGEVNQPTNNNTDNSDNSQINENKTKDNTINSNVSLNKTTDYSIWIANTTINTDKDQRSYKVIWGDTLWLISTAWEVPYKQIAAYNNIPNPDLIYVDQIIYNPIYK